MKGAILITLVLFVTNVAVGFDGFEPICHPATLGDDAWSKSECCCSENCDDRENWILYEGKDDFSRKCNGKCKECECTLWGINSRLGGASNVVTWSPEGDLEAIGSPNLGYGN